MLTRFALAPVVFGLLVACAGAPDGDEQEPVEVSSQAPQGGQTPAEGAGASGNVTTQMRRTAATCECTLAAGDNVWRCNGACSDADLANLPH